MRETPLLPLAFSGLAARDACGCGDAATATAVPEVAAAGIATEPPAATMMAAEETARAP